MIPRRLRLALSLTACAVVTTVAAPATAAARTDGPVAPHDLRRWAADTWASMDAMTVPRTGLTADNITAEGVRSAYTSPTNIGAYLWSTMAARDTRLISRKDARRRMARTLETLETLERSNGMFYNWYDPTTGARLTTWPTNGDPVYGFLSSVDNGWLAAALMMVRRAEPSLRSEASALLEDMNFGFYYDPAVGQLRGGYWPDGRPGATDPCPAVPAGFTCHHYGALNTEPRIASYIGIAAGDIPATHYYKLWRTFPASCDWGWQEMQPAGVTRTYLGVDVFEGHYSHNGLNIVPSWGGSMFEALMVPLLVPEETWGPRSWGVNHPLYVRAQVEHGLDEARYGYWGFSPSNNLEGGYREYGVDTLGLEPNGYYSDQERTGTDLGFGDCRPAQPVPDDYGRGVVTPHASFLALRYAPEEAVANLRRLERSTRFDAYGEMGFFDAIDVTSGQVSRAYLALDQGMIMAALGNALTGDRLRRYFSRGAVEREVRPLLAREEFTAGIAAP